ncbi:peptidase C39 family protein [Leucobacter sp.]
MTETHESISIAVEAGALPPRPLGTGAPEERLALWRVERALWSPRVLVARNASGTAVGAALTAGRPHTASRKIVDVLAEDDAVWTALLGAARDDVPGDGAADPAPLAVHFEEHLAHDRLSDSRRARLAELGFEPAPRPVPSIPSTRPGDPTEVAAWSWWRGERPTRLAPYYGQTTEVTCGAVSSLMALEHLGGGGFDPESLVANRATEIAFWRRATNLPACEPVGLAVETAKAGAESGLLPATPRVVLSAPGPVLVEEFSSNESERMLRTDLQLESLRQAEEMGLPIERRWIEVAEIAHLVRDGAQVLLLIDLTELIADPTPHWVLATDVVDGALVVSDPWVQYPNGETWVDAFALPIPFAGIDLVTRWGDPAYRGVIVLPPAER